MPEVNDSIAFRVQILVLGDVKFSCVGEPPCHVWRFSGRGFAMPRLENVRSTLDKYLVAWLHYVVGLCTSDVVVDAATVY